jgi:ubiquinone biosynthesis protein Coq4
MLPVARDRMPILDRGPFSGALMIDKADADYLMGSRKPLTTESSILISSSKYLNNARLREVFAAEGLRKYGSDLPDAYLVPEALQAFGEVTDHAQLFGLLEREKRQKPELAAWLDARFISTIKAEDVAHCAPGTLGARVHDFIAKSGLEIDFMYRGDPKSDFEYFTKRRTQAHDIEHMVTGFDTDPIGEFALIIATAQSYAKYFSLELSQELSKFSMFLVATGLMRHSLHYPKSYALFLEAFAMAVQLGNDLKRPLFYVKWEDYFDWPMQEIRRELNIRQAPGDGEWKWVFDEMRARAA